MANVTEQTHPRIQYTRWLAGPFAFISLLVIARFGLEVAGMPQQLTRYLSSTGAIFLVAIYLGAVAPLRGVRKSWQIVIPGVLLAAWTQGWVILFTLISAGFKLSRSQFADPQDWGNWRHLAHDVFATLAQIAPISVIILVLMAAMLVLWHWPITVAPGALLGALVVIRFWAQAMNLGPVITSPWSSTIAFLLCGFFLGGVGVLTGLSSPRRLLLPALVLGLTWRFWVFVAVLMSAAIPFDNPHIFAGPQAHLAPQLLLLLAIEVIAVGLFAGIIEWLIALWTERAVLPRALE